MAETALTEGGEARAVYAWPVWVFELRDNGRILVGIMVAKWAEGGEEVVNYTADRPQVDFVVVVPIAAELLGCGPVVRAVS